MSLDGVDEALATAQSAVELARAAGATAAEATVTVGERFSAEARHQTITKLEQSIGKSLHLRVFADSRKATLSTSDMDPERLRSSIDQTVAQARHVADDRYAGLPEHSNRLIEASDLRLFAADVVRRDSQEKLDEALALERLIRKADARVRNSNGAHVGDVATTVALANSNGFAGAYRSTRAHRSVSPVADDAGAKRTASYGTAGRSISQMESVEAVATSAAARAVELFGARKPATMQVPVIFERDVAAAILSDIFAALSAANVSISNSWAAPLAGERVGSDLVTLVDDGTLPGLLGSSPFDGEGIPTRRTVVMERGTLRSFLYDTYYARKLGAASTGNSAGGGIGPNNFFLLPGVQSLEEIIASTQRGVLVLDTIGFATEHASGTYSRGARGFYIENGERAYPIEEFTIASTFPQMLAAIDAVANDLLHDGAIVSPSFRVAEMTVSGN